MNSLVKVSIITVCKNSDRTLEKTVKSVLSQTYNQIEFLIIDGKSSDCTIDILNRYKNHIDVQISESDSGIYSAMNKGLANASGDIIYFLNSDDYLNDENVIGDVANKFRNDSRNKVIFGNIIMNDGKSLKRIKYNNITNRYFYKNTICHQSLFARRSVFEKVGQFDEKYKIHADTDWLLRAYFKHKILLEYFDRDICFFSTLGFCSNPINAEKYKLDRQEISAKFYMEAKIKLAVKKLLKIKNSTSKFMLSSLIFSD